MSKPRGRPFELGNKLGRGRPKGSRNRAKSPEQQLLEEYAPHLYRKCIAQALEGNTPAMRICVALLSSTRPGPSIRLNLPAIRTAQDIDRAAEVVTQGIGHGQLTPDEGVKMMHILESRARLNEVQWEKRLEEVEEKLASAGDTSKSTSTLSQHSPTGPSGLRLVGGNK